MEKKILIPALLLGKLSILGNIERRIITLTVQITIKDKDKKKRETE